MSAPQRPWHWALRDVLSAYLPVLLMALLALATWWLVKNTPLPGEAPAPAPPRHEADYSMRRFTVQRFSKDGPLRVQIDGAVLHHFPDTDTIEIEDVRIRAFGPNGRLTLASARRAIANGDASEVQLVGGAQVTREATGGEPAIRMTSEFLHAFLDRERVRSHLPVIVRRGATEIRADAFEYDHLSRVIDFKGRVRATIAPRAIPRTAPPPANG